MKLIGKDNTLAASYSWKLDEIKTEKDLFELIASVSTIGELYCIEFEGYEDMDEHGNRASFRSVEEFKSGIKDLPKIEPDCASIRLSVGGKLVDVSFYNIDDLKSEVDMSLICDESTIKKTAKILEQKVKEIAG